MFTRRSGSEVRQTSKETNRDNRTPSVGAQLCRSLD